MQKKRQWFVPVAWNVFTQKKRNKHSTHVREQKYKEVGVQTPKRDALKDKNSLRNKVDKAEV